MSRPAGVLLGAGGKLAGDATSRLLQFALIYYAQVSLGPAAYGTLVYGLALGLVCAQIADAGLQLSVTRAMAGDAARAGNIARAGLRMKGCLVLAATVALALLVLGRPAGLRFATWSAAMAVVVATFVEYAGFAFRGLHRVIDDARLAVALRLATVALGAPVLWWGYDVTAFALSQVIATTIVAILATIWLWRRLPADAALSSRLTGWSLLTEAAPLGAAIFISTLYTRTPTFVLDALAGPASVGVFGVAQRLVDPLAMVPSAALAAVFPALVREQHRDVVRARSMRVRTVWGLLALGASVGLCAMLLGPVVIKRLYGLRYAAATAPLQLLAAGLILTFTNYALTHFLVAQHQQRLLMSINALALVVCFVVCGVLVPRVGVSGAAIGLLAGEGLITLTCAMGFRLARRAPSGFPVPPATGTPS